MSLLYYQKDFVQLSEENNSYNVIQTSESLNEQVFKGSVEIWLLIKVGLVICNEKNIAVFIHCRRWVHVMFKGIQRDET